MGNCLRTVYLGSVPCDTSVSTSIRHLHGPQSGDSVLLIKERTSGSELITDLAPICRAAELVVHPLEVHGPPFQSLFNHKRVWGKSRRNLSGTGLVCE